MPVRASEATRATASPAGGAIAPSDDAGFIPASGLSMEHHGAAFHAGAALSMIDALGSALSEVPNDRPGIRLHGNTTLAHLLEAGPIADIARHYIASARPVRALLFDKSRAANWSLGWHQDRTIAVAARRDVPGFGPWSIKAGVIHVEPPFAVIEPMVTLRIYLDDVPVDNAPLLIAPGSHRCGRIAVEDIAKVIARCGSTACLARRGDTWAYATPIVHASAATSGNRRRRVLQVDYSADPLPGGLGWCGL